MLIHLEVVWFLKPHIVFDIAALITPKPLIVVNTHAVHGYCTVASLFGTSTRYSRLTDIIAC